MRGRKHLARRGAPAVRESVLTNGPVRGHVTASGELSVKGMSPHEQQVEDQDRQTEGIMVGSPQDAIETDAMKFGWSEIRHANYTGKRAPIERNLKRVTVDDSYCRV
jgi:hypothetical protein